MVLDLVQNGVQPSLKWSTTQYKIVHRLAPNSPWPGTKWSTAQHQTIHGLVPNGPWASTKWFTAQYYSTTQRLGTVALNDFNTSFRLFFLIILHQKTTHKEMGYYKFFCEGGQNIFSLQVRTLKFIPCRSFQVEY